MENVIVLGKGFLIGFVVSAGSFGPLSLLFARRTLTQGRLVGFLSGLGVAAGDSISSAIAAFGLSLIAGFLLEQQLTLRLAGGLIMCGVGIFLARSVPKDRYPPPTVTTLAAAFLSTFGLTMATPSGIPVFLAVFATFGVPIGVGQIGAAVALGLGVFLGGGSLRFVQTLILGAVRGRLSTRIRVLSFLAGVVICLFGAGAAATSVVELVWRR